MQTVEIGIHWCSRCGTLKDEFGKTSAPAAASRLAANGDAFSALDAAVALSLYHYNVYPHERAQKLYDHFEGACMEIDELVNILVNHAAHAVTELPMPTAQVYVSHALARYGEEAKERVHANLGLFP